MLATTPEHLKWYVDLSHASLSGDERAGILTALLQDPGSGAIARDDHFVALDPEGSPVAAARLVRVGDGEYVLSRISVSPGLSPGELETRLVAEALDRARGLEAHTVLTRPPEAELSDSYRRALQEAGFRPEGVRLEFRAPVESLPLEGASPFEWRSMAETGRELAVEMLGDVAVGDPQGLAGDEDPSQALANWLEDPMLTGSDECVHIGFLEGVPSAFVCAQVARKDGWSRITYMGLVARARGRGLGAFVHRHGFDMMRAQGGRLYQGGTAGENTAMLALFQRHGCEPCARLSEWSWRRD